MLTSHSYINSKDYDSIVSHIKTNTSEDTEAYYNKMHMLAIIFKFFLDGIHNCVNHPYLLNILLYQRYQEIIHDEKIKKNAVEFLNIMNKYIVEGVNKKNILQISYLIQNFFVKNNINDELILTYFVVYSILMMTYQIENNTKVDMNQKTNESRVDIENKEKLIDKIRLFNSERDNISKDTEIDALIRFTRPIYRYYLYMFMKMVSNLGI